jgi:hypothetical protein
LEEGIEKAKRMLICIFKQVQAALDMHQVISAGPFVYLILQEVCSSIVEHKCVSLVAELINWWIVISFYSCLKKPVTDFWITGVLLLSFCQGCCC